MLLRRVLPLPAGFSELLPSFISRLLAVISSLILLPPFMTSLLSARPRNCTDKSTETHSLHLQSYETRRRLVEIVLTYSREYCLFINNLLSPRSKSETSRRRCHPFLLATASRFHPVDSRLFLSFSFNRLIRHHHRSWWSLLSAL